MSPPIAVAGHMRSCFAASPLRRFAASPLRRFAASPLRRFEVRTNLSACPYTGGGIPEREGGWGERETDLQAKLGSLTKSRYAFVPLDGTEFAQLALVVAKQLAQRLGVRIEIDRARWLARKTFRAGIANLRMSA